LTDFSFEPTIFLGRILERGSLLPLFFEAFSRHNHPFVTPYATKKKSVE